VAARIMELAERAQVPAMIDAPKMIDVTPAPEKVGP
jgi:hypothetical protein